MLRQSYPYYLGGEAQQPNQDLAVHDKFTGEVATRVALADARAIDRAIGLAADAAAAMAALPSYRKAAVLQHCARRFQERSEELAYALCVEAGKTIKDSKGEVTRLVDTFKVAAEEATRIGGEVVPLDISARADGYRGQWKRVPIGPVSLISPFNFPLNLAAHKVAPAIAAGCPFVLKPASLTPIGALLIGEVLAETDLPRGSWSILPCPREGAEQLTTDERFKLLSFTGSPDVGWALKAKAGKKKVVLELGGNAACIVDEGADLDAVVPRLCFGAYYQSGQSCISVQRILAHRSLYTALRGRLIAAANALVAGDPKQESTSLGPIISEKEAIRIEGWIAEAKKGGAKLLCGGTREGVMMPAALLEDVPPELPLAAEEVFGPVALLEPFDDFEDALRRVNASRYGLQAGVFTNDIRRAYRAWDVLDVGGVIINDVPSWRVDHMPYGGVKDSGLGREGVRFAIEDMTEIRLMVLKL
ncbi:MAG: aldehyde dehydrogenase family protein [Myxococcales bacterium]|nr:aldehyde dehydrogenase family protein [Myxococcales bacterium]